MSSTKSTVAFAALAFAARAAAHGFVQGITIDGVYHSGYSPSFQYQTPAPVVAGWSDPEDLDNGFIAPDAYTTDDIICHKGATPGQTSLEVAAGGKVELHWNTWPDSHHGPVLDYLAPCSGGDCTTADKTALLFTKVGESGLIDDTTPPGTWATDNLISNNFTWTATIPSTIAAGEYVLRHEIIALHSAGSEGGAQNYPQCINLKVTGSGSDDLSTGGTKATAFYTPTDPGIEISIYSAITDYQIPGPALMSGGSSSSGGAASSAGAASSSAPAASTAAAAAASSAAPASSAAAAVSSAPAAAGSSVAAAATTAAQAPTTLATSVKAAASTPAASSGAADEGEDTCE